MKNLFAAIAALLLPVVASAQLSISGKITNTVGEALPGATVSINNPTASAVADATGKYHFNDLKPGNYTLKVSYIGYQSLTKNVVLGANEIVNIALSNGTLTAEEVTVSSTRAIKNSPTAYTNLSKKDLAKNNFGQDLPYMLNQTPSVVVTSDAGAGIGYTGIRIRGSDATRINVTINGIPYNDSESQGSYFVDLPDITSSIDNIQIQRGVGTSTNGAGAFGGSINVQTTTRRDTAYADINASVGSYGSIKTTASAGTGLLGGHFSLDGRVSRIHSDGYIDRASSNLKSFFVSGAWYGKNSTLRANVFSGYETTYQAWNGIADYVIGDNTRSDNRTYNELGYIDATNSFYKNQVDHYTQNHYQLLYDKKISNKLSFSGALHYTKGKGYYEEYRNADSLKNYGIAPIVVGGNTISATDLVRRLWLNNDFYGVTYALKYQPQTNLNMTLGGAYNQYKGAHYGDVIDVFTPIGLPSNYEYYRDNAKKNDFNIFARAEWHLDKVLLYADMQYRHIYYSFYGIDKNLNNAQQTAELNFFNPKAGITYQFNEHSNVYASFAVGNHEPNRDDYVDSPPQNRPKSENLKDFEAGYRISGPVFTGGINGFYMLYKNQLVLTGALNDVGSPVRTNVKDSYRAGLEFDGKVKIVNQLYWGLTATWSANKIKNYQQFFANEDGGPLVGETLKTTDIAFSPSLTGSSVISYNPVKGGEIAFISKYVSRQYIDNTSNQNPQGYTITPENAGNPYAANRLLNSYFVNDVRIRYTFKVKGVKNIGLGLQVNNIFSEKYEANGATYADVKGNNILNYNYFFPQAPRNFMASVSLSF
ncbi:iron complex outermembrane receptor protein [Mucilaginibacter lappiensis]|uniref:Iron complex outermembrane receptor protein n=1 Tax=Mucilaginibacter lappiensis TaxID=354630 RepID=A0ABR6PL29_9SPHI|nr:TonB-dependent receptor [Mucilaginibacter lappiensis]MBB6110472.1 iron complex outermembrane receptor protein [Mucilaginibacter lappiensis]